MDAGERRELVADALFRIVARDGLHRASVRGVAAEAGLNPGSVRHYFADHADLVRFAMRTMIERVSARVRARVEEFGDPADRSPQERFEAVAEMLGELLPLDDRRRREVAVFLEFTAAARTDTGLADLARESADGTAALVHRILASAADPGRDLHVEVLRLTALLDGLGMAGTRSVAPATPDECRAALRAHLVDVRGALRAT